MSTIRSAAVIVDNLEDKLSTEEAERILKGLEIARAQFAAGEYGTEEELMALLDDKRVNAK